MATAALIPDQPQISTPPPSPLLARNESQALEREHDVIDWTEKLFTSATEDRDREKEIRDTMRAIDYLEGRQWSDKQRYTRERPVLNKTRRHFWEAVGLLTDLALDFQVSLYDKLNDFSPFEQMLNKLAIFWAKRNAFEDRTYDCVLYGLLHTGPAKMQWNSTLNGGMGDIQLVPIAPWQWATLGAGTNPQDAECILFFPVVTKDHLIRKYGDIAKRVETDMEYSSQLAGTFNKPSSISKESWARMGEGLRKSLGVKQAKASSESPYPMLMHKEFWFRDDQKNDSGQTVVVGPALNGKPKYNWCYYAEPGEKLYPRGRIICTAGRVPLEDNPNPYWHTMFPFPVFRPFRVPWMMSGSSTVRSWMQMQNITNKVMGGVLDMVRAIIEPTLIAPKGAFPPSDWDAIDPGAPGGKLKFNNNAPKAPDFVKRAEIPAWVFNYLDMVSKEWDLNSGSSAIQQAMSKKQVPGAESLDMIIGARSLPVKVQSRALTSFVSDVGYMGICNMLQFYSVAHRVAILGSEGFTGSDFQPIYGEALPSGIKPEDFVRKFQFIIRPGSMLSSEKAEKIQAAFALRKLGDLSSQGLFRLLDPNFNFQQNRKELIEEAKLKLMMAALGAAATGKGQHKGK